jgi:hypothetical protein
MSDQPDRPGAMDDRTSLGAGHYQVAMTWIDDALREQPRFHASFRVKVALCGLLGQSEEGRDWLGRLLDLQPGLTIDAWLKHAVTFLAPETRELMVEGSQGRVA